MMMMKERMTPKPKNKTKQNQKGEMCGVELPLPNYS